MPEVRHDLSGPPDVTGPLEGQVAVVAGAARGASHDEPRAPDGRAQRVDVLDGSPPDVWRDTVEVQDRGLPADVTGCR